MHTSSTPGKHLASVFNTEARGCPPLLLLITHHRAQAHNSGFSLKFGGLSKLFFFQNLITIFLIHQSLIRKLLDGRHGLCSHVLKGNYPNNSLRKSKTYVLDTVADCFFAAAADSSPKGGRF